MPLFCNECNLHEDDMPTSCTLEHDVVEMSNCQNCESLYDPELCNEAEQELCTDCEGTYVFDRETGMYKHLDD